MKEKEICFKWSFLRPFNIVLLKYKKEIQNFPSDLYRITQLYSLFFILPVVNPFGKSLLKK